MVQQCSELEEIIEYKKILHEINALARADAKADALNSAASSYNVPRTRSDMSEDAETDLVGSNQMLLIEAKQKKTSLSEKWRKRIQGCRSSGRAAIPVWKSLLSVRRMVLNEREDLETWLEFASLCGQGGNYKLAERILSIPTPPSAMKDRPSSLTTILESGGDMSEISMGRRIQLAKLQGQWTSNMDRPGAIRGLEQLLRSLESSTVEGNMYADGDVHRDCLLKLGRWKLMALEVGSAVDPQTRREVLDLYGKSTIVDPMSYRAWHEVCIYSSI
jgi:FKBP12-rapamycin complex-associated protein